jgi:hypothetical protein
MSANNLQVVTLHYPKWTASAGHRGSQIYDDFTMSGMLYAKILTSRSSRRIISQSTPEQAKLFPESTRF